MVNVKGRVKNGFAFRFVLFSLRIYPLNIVNLIHVFISTELHVSTTSMKVE
jgi:hypothetical protein